MKPTTIEVTMDGHRVIHFEGMLDAAGWAELQRRWDMFKEGDTRMLEDCKATATHSATFHATIRSTSFK